jgi:23S rRNA pseudouridine2457 synthase
MIVLFNKPFNVLSQFTDNSSHQSARETLSRYLNIPAVYPAGRLDRDSEGLLVLTDNGSLQAKISDPRNKVEKTYWTQVEGVPNQHDLDLLHMGVMLKDGVCLPAKVRIIDPPEDLWPRIPAIRVRRFVADSWLEIKIIEGRNRQVRRMTAAIGFPTLRLIRAQVGEWYLDGLQSGKYRLIG